MGAWERYIHRNVPDRLVQLAILHAEFEALHPFLDGNGRWGACWVLCSCGESGLIRAPRFYISAYFEAHRNAYYDGLLSVSRDNDWTGWCRLFLEAVQAQAEDNLGRAQGIFALYDRMKGQVAELTRSRYAIHAMDWIFAHPVFAGTRFLRHGRNPERDCATISGGLGRWWYSAGDRAPSGAPDQNPGVP